MCFPSSRKESSFTSPVLIFALILSRLTGHFGFFRLHNSDEKVSKNDYIPGVRKTNGKKSPPAKVRFFSLDVFLADTVTNEMKMACCIDSVL